MQQLDADSIAILPSAPIRTRNGDTEHVYRQNSDFYYLSGLTEPHSILVLVPQRAEGEFILFTQARDAERERWEGTRIGPEGAKEFFGADQAFSILDFHAKILEILKGKTICYLPDSHFQMSQAFSEIKFPPKIKTKPLLPFIHALRLFKSAAEIDLMQKAAEISAQAHKIVMQKCKPGLFEYQLEAEFIHSAMQQGCREFAYPTIVASGKNATILHYSKNEKKINDGELVLVDAGVEYQHYASDITRTFPANGKFSPEQRLIYEMVLDTQMAVIHACKPGVTKPELQALSEKKLTEHLIQAGILKGNIEFLLEQKAVRAFYFHGVTHWLGMDVHDVGGYHINGNPRVLQPHITMTVEPGLYFEPSDVIDTRFHGIGVRIEDDILVTENEPTVLSKMVPKTVGEIEALMKA